MRLRDLQNGIVARAQHGDAMRETYFDVDDDCIIIREITNGHNLIDAFGSANRFVEIRMSLQEIPRLMRIFGYSNDLGYLLEEYFAEEAHNINDLAKLLEEAHVPHVCVSHKKGSTLHFYPHQA